MKTKIITALLTAAMAVSFAACGQTEETTSSGEAAQQSTQVSESGSQEGAEATQEQTLTVWCWDSFNVDAMKTAGEIYEADHPGVKIDVVETVSSDIQTLVQTYAMSGELNALPDIFLMDDQVFAKYLQNYPEVFADLTDSGINFSDFAASKVANSVSGGRNYGVPYDSNTVIACYRTDYLEQAGYTIDDLTDITWDEFIAIGEDVLAKTGMPMLTNVQGEPDLLNMILQSAGISVFDEQGNIALVDNDGLKYAMNIYMELVQKGILQEQTDWSGYQGSINNGTVVGTINGSWICATIMSTDQAEQEGNWAVTNMPKLNDYDGAANYSAQGGSTWAISSTCSNYDLAVDFFNTTWAGSTEFYDRILTDLGAIATYLPAADSEAYNQTSDYFGGEAIYSKIVSYGSMIPTVNKGIYWSEEKEALGVALANVLGGTTDLDSAIAEAQATVEFNIGQ
ncbi:ABC transporter substrate-binding protein [Candidatus Acetatifactor stercoripullorum]|uniref:ABC transporter substrate-binding protein n=1 Tax=Candidatus Acetatifactor stercoripullorum TaxID=2838414 RepID=UPI00298E0568|nr:extracellular solute-binding protein [Candidatus Acetatifactor stercoripullorum]